MTVRGVALALLLSLAGPGPSFARAVDLRNVLSDYSLTAWSIHDGLPSSEVLAITQDQDGFLWLGTDGGLVRFDGARFTPVAGSSVGRSVRAILMARGGELWVGLGEDGGVIRYRRTAPGVMAEVDSFSMADGLDAGSVRALAEDRDGAVWAGHLGGLFRFHGGAGARWRAEGLDRVEVHALAVASDGRLLVGTRRGVLVSATPDRHRFESLGVPPVREEPVFGLSVDDTGVVWRTDGAHGFAGRLDSPRPVVPGEIARGNRLLHDRSGHLWVGTGGQGLWRVTADAHGRPVVEQSTVTTGLLGNGVVSVFEDRDGNIWAGTLDGLNRLTRFVATPIQSLGLVSGVESTPQGIWIMTADSLLLFPPGGDIGAPVVKHRGEVKAIHADERGRLWMSAGERIWWFDDAGRHEPSGGLGTLRSIGLVASNRRGGLWLSDAERGLHVANANGIRPAAVPPALQRAKLTWMETTVGGTLWLATTDGRLASVDPDGRTREYGGETGPDIGAIRAWHLDTTGALWVGGQTGLARLAEGRFTIAREAHGHRLEGLTAIVEDDDGQLWVAVRSGLLRVSADDLRRHLSAPADPVPLAYINKADGLAGNPRWYGHRGAIRDPHGRLWFVTSRGLSVVEPTRISGARPVDASVDTVVVDGHATTDGSVATLAPGTRRLDIQFGALALASPATIRFRYRLDGFDAGWVDAGTHRSASYTNLAPGAYRFHVMATNTDGTWPDRAAAWAFEVEPMFYQTPWFFTLCLAAVLGVVTLAWRLHLRRIRAEMSILLAERARVAREIHDTLLQGLFGVALRCDAIAADVQASAPQLNRQFIDLRHGVEQYVREARQSILGLRSPALEQLGLAAALRTTGEHLTAGSTIRFRFGVAGTVRSCRSEAEEHLLRIGQEAITNAVRHARAEEVRAELRYAADCVVLRVTDDGRGVDNTKASHTGGLGLVSMRERARAAGGSVRIQGQSGRGTQVEVTVPYGTNPRVA